MQAYFESRSILINYDGICFKKYVSTAFFNAIIYIFLYHNKDYDENTINLFDVIDFY